MIFDILQLKDSASVLRGTARKLTIEEIQSQEIQSLIQDMKETMRAAPGVGLAAPQIGKPIQLAVIEDSKERLNGISPLILKERSRVPIEFHVIINPVIKKRYGNCNYFFEGCLSIKNKARITPRYDYVQAEYLDDRGLLQRIEAAGWYARILQHEIDHLHGHLYIDIADEKTELNTDDEFRNKWLNASREDIINFYNEKCID